MKRLRPLHFALLSSSLAVFGAFGRFSSANFALTFAEAGTLIIFLALACLVLSAIARTWSGLLMVPISLYGSYLLVIHLQSIGARGLWGYWSTYWGFLGCCLLAIGQVSLAESGVAEPKALQRLRRTLPPASVPFVLLLLWQGAVIGNRIPKGIFPGVHDVYVQLIASFGVLMRDSYVTFVQEVAFGFAIGLTAGIIFGIAIAYSRFLQQGFLPLAAAFGAVPIVGLAPVLGRAFGVDWQSKAAVVVIVTFFPVVLNTVQGLLQLDPVKLELLRAYAAKPHQIFFKLRLPNALPYLFNAIKLGVVLSVISVIVAEFLIPGPPRGLGQRISLSARQGAFDVVFAAIFVSSVISITLYGLLSLLERTLTGWHPSFREDSGV
jgi:NitT/TauT family transport system permease protein